MELGGGGRGACDGGGQGAVVECAASTARAESATTRYARIDDHKESRIPRRAPDGHQRQILNQRCSGDGAERGCLGLQLRALAGNVYHFRCISNLQGNVQTNGLSSVENDPFVRVLLKAGVLNADVVPSDRKVRYAVDSVAIGNYFAGDSSCGRRDRYLCACNHGAGRITYDSGYGSTISLRPDRSHTYNERNCHNRGNTPCQFEHSAPLSCDCSGTQDLLTRRKSTRNRTRGRSAGIGVSLAHLTKKGPHLLNGKSFLLHRRQTETNINQLLPSSVFCTATTIFFVRTPRLDIMSLIWAN